MQPDLTFALTSTLAQCISIIAILTLFVAYFRLPKKTEGLQMILQLCISDFIYHIAILFFTWWPSPVIQEIVKPIIHTTLRFSIFWATCMAYLVYTSLDPTKSFSSAFNSKTAFWLCLLISITLSIICALVNQIYFLVITMIAPLSLSLALTTIFYLKSIAFLRNNVTTQKSMSVTIRSLSIYSIIHLIPAAPIVAFYIMDMSTNDELSPFRSYVSLPIGLAGLINTFAYFFQRRCSKAPTRKPTSELNLDTLDKPLAIYGMGVAMKNERSS